MANSPRTYCAFQMCAVGRSLVGTHKCLGAIDVLKDRLVITVGRQIYVPTRPRERFS